MRQIEIITDAITRIKRNRILIIGDIMIDQTVTGEMTRGTDTSTNPVFVEYGSKMSLGGAANLANNAAMAGQSVALCSIVGDDYCGIKLKEFLTRTGIDASNIIVDTCRKTTVKKRYYLSNNKQIFRSDYEDKFGLSSEIENKMICQISDAIRNCSIVVLSDYDKGCLTSRLVDAVIELSRRYSIRVFVDTKTPDISRYYGVYLIKQNRNEFFGTIGGMANNTDIMMREAQCICQRNRNSVFIATLDKDGMLYAEKSKGYIVPAVKVKTVNAIGAGDVVMAYLSVGSASGLSITQSVHLANFAAGISVGKSGISTISLGELRRAVHELE